MIFWDMAPCSLADKYLSNCMVLYASDICNSGIRWGCEVSDMSWLLNTVRDMVPIEQKAGWAPGAVWTGVENLTPTGVWSLQCLDHGVSLYCLHYPSPQLCAAISHHSENIISDFRYKIYHHSSSGYDVMLYPRMDTSSTSQQKCKNLHNAKDSFRLLDFWKICQSNVSSLLPSTLHILCHLISHRKGYIFAVQLTDISYSISHTVTTGGMNFIFYYTKCLYILLEQIHL